jgi:hypothetical protein
MQMKQKFYKDIGTSTDMPQLTNDWFLGAIDSAGSFGISVSLQDEEKPYLKWFFTLKTRDKMLADLIKKKLDIGTVRKIGRKWCLVVERVEEIDTLSKRIDFSQLRSPSTHHTFMLWQAAYLQYRILSPYERRQPKHIIPILQLRDDLNKDSKTPRYNDCKTICKRYGWS